MNAIINALTKYPDVSNISTGYGSPSKTYRDIVGEFDEALVAKVVWTIAGHQLRVLSAELDGSHVHLLTIHTGDFNNRVGHHDPDATAANCTHVFMISTLDRAMTVAYSIIFSLVD